MNKRTTAKPPFTFQYTFDAPKHLVFNAFGNAEALNEWWGPVDSHNTVVKLDFSPGGIFHFSMQGKDGKISYGRMLFKTIQPHDLLEFSNAFADEKANVVKAPFDIPLPLEIHYRIVFTEAKGKTTIRMTGEAGDGTQEEVTGFASIFGGMETGFGASFSQLSKYLAKKK